MISSGIDIWRRWFHGHEEQERGRRAPVDGPLVQDGHGADFAVGLGFVDLRDFGQRPPAPVARFEVQDNIVDLELGSLSGSSVELVVVWQHLGDEPAPDRVEGEGGVLESAEDGGVVELLCTVLEHARSDRERVRRVG